MKLLLPTSSNVLFYDFNCDVLERSKHHRTSLLVMPSRPLFPFHVFILMFWVIILPRLLLVACGLFHLLTDILSVLGSLNDFFYA